jgi:toxin ParE1/3/4
LRAVEAYIRQFSPLASRRFALRLFNTGMALADQAECGRPISRGRRELTIIAPYLIRYRVREGRVEILSIRHGARDQDS